MKKNNQNKDIKNYSKQMIAIAVALILVIGGSYAWLTLTLNGTKTNEITAGNLVLTLDKESSAGINLENAVPMSDTDGMATTAYTFTLKNSGNIPSNYAIYLKDDTVGDLTRMDDTVVKYSLSKDGGTATTALLSALDKDENGRKLSFGTIAAGETGNEYTYTLKLWIDEDAGNEVMGKAFAARINVVATQIQE